MNVYLFFKCNLSGDLQIRIIFVVLLLSIERNRVSLCLRKGNTISKAKASERYVRYRLHGKVLLELAIVKIAVSNIRQVAKVR